MNMPLRRNSMDTYSKEIEDFKIRCLKLNLELQKLNEKELSPTVWASVLFDAIIDVIKVADDHKAALEQFISELKKRLLDKEGTQ